MRLLLTIIVPFLVPTLLYLLWLAAMRRTSIIGLYGWQALPWSWLLGAGVAATAAMLIVVNVQFGRTPQGTYVPPRAVDGKVEEGHFVPSPPARP